MNDCFLERREASACLSKPGSKECLTQCETCGHISQKCTWWMSDKEIKKKLKELEL